MESIEFSIIKLGTDELPRAVIRFEHLTHPPMEMVTLFEEVIDGPLMPNDLRFDMANRVRQEVLRMLSASFLVTHAAGVLDHPSDRVDEHEPNDPF